MTCRSNPMCFWSASFYASCRVTGTSACTCPDSSTMPAVFETRSAFHMCHTADNFDFAILWPTPGGEPSEGWQPAVPGVFRNV
eukprot:1147379-Pelagomonas_calceolata.AAC.2